MKFQSFTSHVCILVIFCCNSVASNQASFRFKNQCPHSIDLHQVTGAVANSLKRVVEIAAGSRHSPTYADQTISLTNWNGLFRHTRGNQATLAEFTLAGGKAWYDISIIPPGCSGRYGCKSLDCCKQHTQKTGFNVPMMIEPITNNNKAGFRCNTIMCRSDGCKFRNPVFNGNTFVSAFHFPTDTRNVFSCPSGTTFDVIFCP